MFSVASVHHSVRQGWGVVPFEIPSPQSIGAHCTDPPPTLDMGPHWTGIPLPLLMISGDYQWRPVQTCSLQDPRQCWHVVTVEACTASVSRRYASYWNRPVELLGLTPPPTSWLDQLDCSQTVQQTHVSLIIMSDDKKRVQQEILQMPPTDELLNFKVSSVALLTLPTFSWNSTDQYANFQVHIHERNGKLMHIPKK